MNQRRIAYIDTLRGLAAVCVVAYHLRLIAQGAPLRTPAWVAAVTDHVFDAGVPLFFSISGFLLCMLMPSYERHRRPTASFYAKRFFRIAPLFYVAILLWSAWSRALPQAGPLAANVTFVFNLVPSLADSVIFAGWTIGVEMLFYAAFPFLYPRLRGAILKTAAVVGSLALASLVDEAIIRAGWEPRYTLLTVFHSLPMFFFGMLAFDVVERLRDHRAQREFGILFLALSALAFDLVLSGRTVLVPERYWQGLACVLLLIAFAVRPSVLVNRATAFVGRISYSIYLLHGLVIIIMGRAFLAPYRWGLPSTLAYGADVLMALAAILPVAWVAFELIEQPGNRLGTAAVRWLDRGWSGIASPREELAKEI